MRKLSLIVLSMAALTCGCRQHQTVGSVVGPEVLAQAGLNYYWDSQLALGDKEQVDAVYLVGENIYCRTNQNVVWALSARTGEILWFKKISDAAETVFAPCHVDGMRLPAHVPGITQLNTPENDIAPPFDAVLFNTLSQVQVYDRTNGDLKRSVKFNFPANTAGVCDGRLFYVGSTKGWCQAIALREAMEIWSVATAGLLTAPMEIAGKDLYIGGQDGTVTCVAAGMKGGIIWRKKLSGAVVGAMVADNRGVFVASDDNRVYGLAAANGEPMWQPLIVQGPFRAGVQAESDSVFGYAFGDKFYAVDAATGKIRWTLDLGRRVVAVVDRTVYVMQADGMLAAVDEMSGQVRSLTPMAGLSGFASNTSAAGVFAANRDGLVRCIRPISAGRLTTQQLRASTQPATQPATTEATTQPLPLGRTLTSQPSR